MTPCDHRAGIGMARCAQGTGRSAGASQLHAVDRPDGTVEPERGTVSVSAGGRARWPPPGTAHHGRSACVGYEEPLSVFFSVWVWRWPATLWRACGRCVALPYRSRCPGLSYRPAPGLITVVACSASCALKGKAEETVLTRDDLRPLHREDLCAEFVGGVFRVVCWLGTHSRRLHTDVGTRDRRCATGRSGRG